MLNISLFCVIFILKIYLPNRKNLLTGQNYKIKLWHKNNRYTRCNNNTYIKVARLLIFYVSQIAKHITHGWHVYIPKWSVQNLWWFNQYILIILFHFTVSSRYIQIIQGVFRFYFLHLILRIDLCLGKFIQNVATLTILKQIFIFHLLEYIMAVCCFFQINKVVQNLV